MKNGCVTIKITESNADEMCTALFLGTCWTSLQGTACAEQLLGGRGLDIQVLRGYLCRSVPQGHSSWSRNPMDLQTSRQAPWNARPYLGQSQVPWSWKGPWLQQDKGWISPCLLEAQQHCSDAQEEAVNGGQLMNAHLWWSGALDTDLLCVLGVEEKQQINIIHHRCVFTH